MSKGKNWYMEKLRHPKWQKKRLQILDRDEFCCHQCFSTENTLHVHHKIYESGKDPWDYPDTNFITLCEKCHTSEHEAIDELPDLINDLCRNTNMSQGTLYRFLHFLLHGDLATDLENDFLWTAAHDLFGSSYLIHLIISIRIAEHKLGKSVDDEVYEFIGKLESMYKSESK